MNMIYLRIRYTLHTVSQILFHDYYGLGDPSYTIHRSYREQRSSQIHVDRPRARSRSRSGILRYFVRTRIKRIGLRCERTRVLDASRHRHANASRAILIRVVFEAPGFPRTRIIRNDHALRSSRVVFRVKRIHAIETTRPRAESRC